MKPLVIDQNKLYKCKIYVKYKLYVNDAYV